MIGEDDSTMIIQEKDPNIGQNENEVYHCTYRFGSDQIELQYDKLAHQWQILSIQSNFQLDRFESLKEFLSQFQSIDNLSFDQQIQLIIKKFDQFFSDLNSVPLKFFDNESFRDDEIISHLKLPSTSNRIRQESSSSANSIRYTSFIPSPRLSLSYRRVIYSIVLNVKIKRTSFEKFSRLFRFQPSSNELRRFGSQFLDMFDGKFNYETGHQFVLPFENHIWILTIESLRCVQCRVGDEEPKSILILHYKDEFHSIQN